MAPQRLTRPNVGRSPVLPAETGGAKNRTPGSVPMANAARPAATIAPEPLELPHVQQAAFHGFFAGPFIDAEANRYPIPPASSIIADLPIRIAPARSRFSNHSGIIVESADSRMGERPTLSGSPAPRANLWRHRGFRAAGRGISPWRFRARLDAPDATRGRASGLRMRCSAARTFHSVPGNSRSARPAKFCGTRAARRVGVRGKKENAVVEHRVSPCACWLRVRGARPAPARRSSREHTRAIFSSGFCPSFTKRRMSLFCVSSSREPYFCRMNWIFDPPPPRLPVIAARPKALAARGSTVNYGSGPGPPMDELGPAAIPAAAKAARRANSRRDNPVCGLLPSHLAVVSYSCCPPLHARRGHILEILCEAN